MERSTLHDLFERGPELAALTELVAAPDEGGLTLIVGEPGIGKTALLRAARDIAATHDILTLAAHGAELEQELPFGLVRQLIEPVLLIRPAAAHDALFAGAASHARALFIPPSPSMPIDPDPDFGVLHGLYWLVASLAQERPLLLAIDDLQWGDAASLRFLQFLLRRVEGLPILLIATLRSGTQGPAVELIDEPRANLIKPRALSEMGVGELLTERLGNDAGERLSQACRRTTGGVPLYVLAVLDELVEAGGQSGPEDLDAIGPDAVVRSVDRRLNALGAQAATVAEAIAILGDATELELAGRLSGLDESSSRKAARSLVNAAILAPGELLAFAHPVVRAAVYRRLDSATAEHTRAARLLVETGAAPDEVALQLLRATPGTVAGAGDVLRQAAARALAGGAPEAAASLFARLLEEPLAPDDRGDVLLELGLAEARAGLGEAIAHLEQARQSTADPRRRAAATLTLARTLYTFGRAGESIELLHEEALAQSEHSPENARELEAELWATADVDLASRPLARSLRPIVAQAPPQDIPADPVLCAHYVVALLMSGDSASRAAELAERALSDGRLERQATAGGALYAIVAYTLSLAGAVESSERWLTRALDGARAHGSGPAFAAAGSVRAFVRNRRGALAEAEADARASLELAALNGWTPLAQMALAPLIEVLIERGQPALAAAAAAAAGIDLDDLPETTQGIVLLEARGRMHIAMDEASRGVADLLRVGERLLDWGVEGAEPFSWRSHAARALARTGERERAAILMEQELTMARRWGAPRTVGAALRASAELASGEEQLALFAEAVDTLEGSPAQLELAHALTHLGAALRRAGRRADARAPLSRGLELARRCGATPLVHRAHTELWATGARPRTPLRRGIDALTASERRVADMAAAGLSNPDIAQALFVTVKTVEMHLTSTYRKLGIAARSELPSALVHE